MEEPTKWYVEKCKTSTEKDKEHAIQHSDTAIKQQGEQVDDGAS